MAAFPNPRPSSSRVFRTGALPVSGKRPDSRPCQPAKVSTVTPCPPVPSGSIRNPEDFIAMLKRVEWRRQAFRDAVAAGDTATLKELGRDFITFDVPPVPDDPKQ